VRATRAQGRWPADFDEAEFRRHYVSWTETHVRGGDPDSTTSVIELAGEAVGRLRIGLPLELSVEHDNPRARTLYEHLSFLKIGEDANEARFRWQPDYDPLNRG